MKWIKNTRPSRADELLARPSLQRDELDQLVKQVFWEVEREGDAAVARYSELFDGFKESNWKLDRSALEELAERVAPEVKTAIDRARTNIQAFHEAQGYDELEVETMPGVVCRRRRLPISSVGLYIPGGSAPLFSTVLMLAVPADIAGVKQKVLVTPPNRAGSVAPEIAYCALSSGITEIYLVGGIQAIAALSIGTDSIPKVDKIFGPGNAYVTAAKQFAQNYGVAMDLPAGPSEVMVVGDGGIDPAYAASDLLAQAEHGPDSQVVLLSTDEDWMEAVNEAVIRQKETLPRIDIINQSWDKSLFVLAQNEEELVEWINTYAPEHLILAGAAEQLAEQPIRAGSIFLGAFTPETTGDYASGTNHTLPTGLWARNYSGVSVDSFCVFQTLQRATKEGLASLQSTLVQMARAERLEAHARAVEVRFNAKQP
ncbi:histidinol dehydrogenase [Cryomorphaceae bacterium]|nr:histidinol dehydrogenase [Cryomorphaceae bacterium]